jgi:leukotriene A-4 hydrolase/aminopeptidase
VRATAIPFTAIAVLLAACGTPAKTSMPVRRDVHSYSNPHQVVTTHVELDLEVRFDSRTLAGTVTLPVKRIDPGAPLILDTRDLKIRTVEAAAGEKGTFAPAKHELAQPDRILGAALAITLPEGADRVRISYETSPAASALQWLEPSQTAGGREPFLFTQSQAIHARSWIPLQDSPGVRTTYRARIRTPKHLIALMSARRDFRLADRNEPPNGDYTFRMPQAIPSYLIALAVGDLEFREMGYRTGVWAEPKVVVGAGKEFSDTERMMQAAEKLYGPYQWLRYDLLVLPPSFPFGGMENPMLTFATPTVIAGDKSLVNLIAHELAHSWSGNLVTNATWRDFWLNEGFTVYVERRIQEIVYGEERARMEAVLGRQDLEKNLAKLPPNEQLLFIDLEGRDPDDGVTEVAYEKGALFLTALEQAFGRDRFDAFLRGYFAHFQFQSITTETFRAYLKEKLLDSDPAAAAKVPVEEWITQPGIPAAAPRTSSDAFRPVEEAAAAWKSGKAPEGKPDWNTQQWLHFLRALEEGVDSNRMAALDRAYGFSRTGNSEILFQWLMMAVKAGYGPAYRALDEFLTNVGRRKFVKPLFEELSKSAAGKVRAVALFAKVRHRYHPITASSVEQVLAK